MEELFKRGRKPKVTSALLRIMNNAVIDTQPNGEEIMYFSGKFIGSDIMKNYQKRKKYRENMVYAVKDAVERLGVGTVKGVDIGENRVRLYIGNCMLSGRRGKGMCQFLSGIMSGIISQGSGKSYTGKVMKYKDKNGHSVFLLKARK